MRPTVGVPRRKVFGRHREVEKEFDNNNDELFKASFGAQFAAAPIE